MNRSPSRYLIVAALVVGLFAIVQVGQRFTGDVSPDPTTAPTAPSPAATVTARLSADEQARADAEQQARLADEIEAREGSFGPTAVPVDPLAPGSVRLIVTVRDEMPLDVYVPSPTDHVARCVISPRGSAGWIEAEAPGGEETVSTSIPVRALRSPDGACEARIVMDVPARGSYDVRVGLEGSDGEDRAVLMGPRTISISGDTSKVVLVG
ncbi:hypothetical protein [Aeromicrobium fastidiosum]|uniref:Uncharacterized protein n=1 Tax=Aeromicrobium fastidiosum TaxID=52699 RepID=A0A641AJZ7_9ACTN|nr:hypothetical protein [Aeromicrobium fastidiosum]KAA1376171.1 hypothetical protein ESP62_012070 [Aeromicrobium fastidiosum]MBP2391943.1 hypothetical protein [Aeromicrobium fastidiosum]